MIFIDEHEPAEIYRALDLAYPIELGPRNADGYPDYYYSGVDCYCHKSNEYHTERKTWTDLLDLNSVENQVGKWLKDHPSVHNRLIIEGVVEPAPNGILVYRKHAGLNRFEAGNRGSQSNSYKAIMAWIRQAGKYIEIVQTTSMAATAITIGAYYVADNIDDEQHQTFHRYFKDVNWHPNPQVTIILGAAGKTPIGPVKAEALAHHFGTAWRAFRAPLSEWVSVPGIGTTLATSYLRGIGRGDI